MSENKQVKLLLKLTQAATEYSVGWRKEAGRKAKFLERRGLTALGHLEHQLLKAAVEYGRNIIEDDTLPKPPRRKRGTPYAAGA